MKNRSGIQKFKIQFSALICVLVLWLAAIEGIAWVAFFYGPNVGKTALWALDPYEVEAQDIPGHWRLRPGYNMSKEELIAAKLTSGKWLGAEAIRADTERTSVAGRFSINTYGFKGPPINTTKGCPRIIAIGDSVTFGIGTLSYPMFMQQRFDQAGIDVEVINAGVEGYTPTNSLYEMERYLGLQPDIAIVLIGWNELYRLDRYSLFKTPWLMRRAGIALTQIIDNDNDAATQFYEKKLNAHPDDAEIQTWSETSLPFVEDIEVLSERLKESGAKVYLVSLFSLFNSSTRPSDKALKKGHLPEFTDNPYVLKAITENYNRKLKILAQKLSLSFIDLNSWGQEQLIPVDNYFFDSVHFNVDGLEQVGFFLADAIANTFAFPKHQCMGN